MRYFIGFLIFILLIVMLVALIFRGGDEPKVPSTAKTLDSYASTDAQVIMTTDGPLNADANHEQIRITVDRDNATFEYIKGYQGKVVKMQHYPNNEPAYTNFLAALGRAGFTQGDNSPALRDERGYCPSASRFIYELKQGTRNIQRYWASDCGKPKSYLGSVTVTNDLFQDQIPDYDTLLESLNVQTL